MKTTYFLLTAIVFALLSFSFPAEMSKEVVAKTNEFRKQYGLPALQEKENLNEIAQQHSEAMAKGRIAFGHNGFNARHEQASPKIKSLYSFAENVAYGAETAAQVVENWKNSPGHRKNMLGKYQYIGVGIARSKNGQLYYTQIFGG
ncbi:MAG: CAP domain-containing protein [Chitinophagaceae bacterium]|nr:MAG: CAP domain-containing protein [Chitinophagaceae bacterium]